MEYIKRMLSDNFNGVIYIVCVLVILLILVTIFIIRRRKLINQTSGINQNITGDMQNNINNVSSTTGISNTSFNNKSTLNTLTSTEDVLNNSFVVSVEENAAKRATESVNKNNASNV